MFLEPRPKIRVERIYAWVSRDDCARIWPRFKFFDEFGVQWVEKHVLGARDAERMFLSFFCGKDPIMRLMLKFHWFKKATDLCPEKFNAIALIGIASQSHPDE